MNLPLFIAYRQTRLLTQNKSIISPIVKLSTICVTISVATMLISSAVLLGFKNQISEKVVGFLSDISIVNYDANTSFETQPINGSMFYFTEIEQFPFVKNIHPYIIKASIISTDSIMEGVVLKGVESNYNWTFFEQHIVKGRIPKIIEDNPSNEILISQRLSLRIKANVGDKLSFYFVDNPMRVRRFEIVGIYNTQLEEFDKIYAFCDLKHLRKLNDWDSTQITGYEILLTDKNKIKEHTQTIEEYILANKAPNDRSVKVESIQERYQSIFDWLALQDLNALVIIVLMALVAGFNMISGILVLLFFQISSIGILKTLGSSNLLIRKIYFYQSGLITIKGLLYGNILALILLLCQQYFKVVSLNPDTYYLDHVPVEISPIYWLSINIIGLVFILSMTLLPLMIVRKISPSDIIRIS